ncbi:WYL domain-containing protein [Paenibacillus psychroresistens]|uniref:WYL domain-containing protein n=1 Tax=Paenibacillus psychroresistens TaxID=1778678 RepID=A0A6B8RTU3_9BACL|nr:WYL domain-containing protein [Paenibacillus psychroresistens]QGQ99327.1 WYL domain-containing protein [Paenibacillus psychroresistens]
MSSMHRIVWIDNEIRQHHYPSCAAIAERFSISVRQAARDVEYLKDSMCAPIEYSHSHKGYLYTEGTFMLGHVVMTEQQRHGLTYLANRYAQMEGEHATHLARLFRRLIDESPTEFADQAIPLFPLEPRQMHIFDTMQEAILSSVKVELHILDEKSSVKFSPYKIYTFRGENYVVGYYDSIQKIRFFSFTTISNVYRLEEKYDLTPLLRQAEIMPELTYEPEVAVVHFDVADYAWTFRYNAKQMSCGKFQIEYDDPNKLIAALFVCPCLSSIESPRWLRNKYRHELKRKLGLPLQ